jgi:hypothetical protein
MMFFGNRKSQFERRTTVIGPLGGFWPSRGGLLSPVAGAAHGVSTSAAIPRPAGGELIPYEKFTLANGLTVAVHTDRKAPILAVDVWYHLGSKNESPGKTGFAHLFEHLMIQGSEHYDDEYFKPFEQVGATSMNGITSFDRTNYFENVPTTSLDLALWMESDRMGYLLDVVTQPRLDEQRDVSRTRSCKARIVPTAAYQRPCTARACRRGIPTARCRSVRWPTLTPRCSTTCASGSAPITARPATLAAFSTGPDR